MPKIMPLKARILDEKDAKLLMLLQADGRQSLTELAKGTGLSIDSTHNRVKEMLRKGIFETGIFIDPRKIGFPLIVDVKIKIGNISPEDKDNFIEHLTNHPRVTSLFSITGSYDFLCTIIAKDTSELEKIITQIRNRFGQVISDWDTTLFLKTYKLERYDVAELFAEEQKASPNI